MMGLNEAQTELWVEPVNLARRVPEDHFLGKLNKTLDLGFVRREVSRFYGRNGNVSVDPVIIMKMMLLLFLDNVRSERELTGVVNEAHELVELTEAHQANTGAEPKVVVADSLYGTVENFTELGAEGIVTHMGDLRAKQRNHREEGIFEQSAFRYDRKKDRYTCPAEEELVVRGIDYQRGYAEYAAGKGVCNQCFLRDRCTRSKEGRTINRYGLQEVLDRARRQSASKRGIKDRKRRQHLQERNFADAANLHGFKRARWRGLWR